MVNLKELDPDSSELAAFGARLREWRSRRGQTQDDLGQAIGYSGTHISAVETGRRAATLTFARNVDVALGFTDSPDSFEREWRKIKYGAMIEGFPEYVAFECEAVEIRIFQLGVVPGLLQTPEYARAQVGGYVRRGSVTAEEAAERLAVLAERQAVIERDRPPMIMVVMDESCLRQMVGGPGVMAAQYDRLIEVASQPYRILQVAPFSLGEERSLVLPVNILTMPNGARMSYVESQTTGHLDKEDVSVTPLLVAYHQLQAVAVSPADTLAMIRELRREVAR